MAKEWLMEDWKNCAICKELKQIKDFAPNKVRGAYQYSRCRPCDQKKKHDWNKANYERQYENQKERMKANPEFYKEIKDKWKENNPEKVKELRKNWEVKNAEYCNEKKNSGQNLRNSGIINHLLALQKNKCMYCDKQFIYTKEHSKDKYSIDHFIPTKTGFNDSYSNLSLCCMECNFMKNHQLPEIVFGEERSRNILKKIIANAELLVSCLNSFNENKTSVNENVSRILIANTNMSLADLYNYYGKIQII